MADYLREPMTELNCHFISRFLTKQWEFGKRQLHFYNVRKHRFEHMSSKNLFARPGLNSKILEARIGVCAAIKPLQRW
jgi:hypothetical protein